MGLVGSSDAKPGASFDPEPWERDCFVVTSKAREKVSGGDLVLWDEECTRNRQTGLSCSLRKLTDVDGR